MTARQVRSSERTFQPPLNRTLLLYFGFGYLRNRTNQPWFKRSDLVEAIPVSSGSVTAIPTQSNHSQVVREIIRFGFAEGQESAPGDKGRYTPHARLRIIPEGEELLLESLDYSVTHQGSVVPDLLVIPEVTEAVLAESDLVLRVVSRITGLSRASLEG